jgi:hypothetical protein
VLTRLKYPVIKTTTTLRTFSVFSASNLGLSQVLKSISQYSNKRFPLVPLKESWPKDLEYYKKLSALHEVLEKNILTLFKIIKADTSRSSMPNEIERDLIQDDLDRMTRIRTAMGLLVNAARLEGREFVKQKNGEITAEKITVHTIHIPRPS